MQKQDKNENIKETSIHGVYLVRRPLFSDNRGFFHEVVRINELMDSCGIDFKIVQVSHSRSYPHVIRAIHTEKWNKLVYPVNGKIFVAIVDTRPESKSFGKYETFIFNNSGEYPDPFALFLPPGIGNSMCVIGAEPVDYIYAVDEYWDNSKAQGIAWDDPDINIRWPIKDPIISDRDKNNLRLREIYPDKFK